MWLDDRHRQVWGQEREREGGRGIEREMERDRERVSERTVVSRRDHYLAAPHTSISPVSITLGRGYHINGEEGEGGG